jgi:hypothetical protein
MLSKKSLLFFTIVFLFVVFAVSAQESANNVMKRFNMPENCQDAISQFPLNLQSGFQGIYIALTGYMNYTDEDVRTQMVLFLMANYIKTNIILQGKGNEKMGSSDKTYSQFYSDIRIQAIQFAAMCQISVLVYGNPGGTNWDMWSSHLMEWL